MLANAQVSHAIEYSSGTGAASDVEYPPGGWHAAKSQVRRAVGDLVMQPTTPALVIALRALAERRDITITGRT